MNYTPTHGGSIMNKKNLKIADTPENRYVSTINDSSSNHFKPSSCGSPFKSRLPMYVELYSNFPSISWKGLHGAGGEGSFLSQPGRCMLSPVADSEGGDHTRGGADVPPVADSEGGDHARGGVEGAGQEDECGVVEKQGANRRGRRDQDHQGQS